MVMSQLSQREQGRLENVALWVREYFGEHGHHIGVALDQHSSFRGGQRPRSSLARSMMQSALGYGIGQLEQANLAMGTDDGGVQEIRSIDRRYSRSYRVLMAQINSRQELRILSSSDKILDVDEESYFFEERWVWGYTLTDDNQIEVLFVAEVLDRREGNPGELILGPKYFLQGNPPTAGRFLGTDEELPWPDEEGDAGISDIG